MPADHPPTGKQQQQGLGPVLAGATPLPTQTAAAAVSAAGADSGPQYVFLNGNIWTANPQVSSSQRGASVAGRPLILQGACAVSVHGSSK
jgi:hypothetical protein